MYKIIKDGTVFGLVDEPRYVQMKNEVFVQCSEENADGVAFNGQFYRFSFKEIDGYDPIDIQPVNSGEYILQHETSIEGLNKGLTDTQLALCDAYESGLVNSEEVTNLQIALTEVYEMVLGVS